MTDLEIRYPTNFDLLPFTTQVSVNIGDNINALRDAILNLQHVLGLDVNVGLFSPDPSKATVAERLTRLERGIADRNLVFRELNVSDALQVLLTPDNKPFVRLGLSGIQNQPIAPVTILGPLTILAPAVEAPLTLIQTPVAIDVSTVDPQASSFSLIKGKSNNLQPLLSIQDTNFNSKDNEYALDIKGNVKISGKLTAEFSIEHSKLLGTETVPTNLTRGIIKHVTQGDWHSHRKKSYDEANQRWVVDSLVNTQDYGIIRHSDLVGIGTLPTHGDEFIPTPGISYHVTGGDTHDHKSGRGAQIDHNDLKNINPKFSNHVSGGDTHTHNPILGDGGIISHLNLSDVDTVGINALHVTGGDNHSHSLDDSGNPIGDGAQIDHQHLKNIGTKDNNSLHVTSGDNHSHGLDDSGNPIGDGAQIDHQHLKNIGTLTHNELEIIVEELKTSLSNHKHSGNTNDFGQTISHASLSDRGTLSHTALEEKFTNLNSYIDFTATSAYTPTNGLYRSGTDTLAFATNSTNIGSIDGYGAWTLGTSSVLTNKQSFYGEIDGYGTAIALSNSSFRNSITHIKNAGTATSLTNTSTATFAFGSGAGALLMITNTTSSNSALYFISQNSSVEVSDPSNTFSNTGTSGTVITCATGTVTIQNYTGSAASYKIVAISTI